MMRGIYSTCSGDVKRQVVYVAEKERDSSNACLEARCKSFKSINQKEKAKEKEWKEEVRKVDGKSRFGGWSSKLGKSPLPTFGDRSN